MTKIASQITSLTVVFSTVYSEADQRKHQSSASLAFVWGIHRPRWIPRTKGQLRGKCFHLMTSSWVLVCAYGEAVWLNSGKTGRHIWMIYSNTPPNIWLVGVTCKRKKMYTRCEVVETILHMVVEIDMILSYMWCVIWIHPRNLQRLLRHIGDQPSLIDIVLIENTDIS